MNETEALLKIAKKIEELTEVTRVITLLALIYFIKEVVMLVWF